MTRITETGNAKQNGCPDAPPIFETSRMVSRGGRKINSKTARSMLTWSHYAFRALLKAKAELYPWVKVIECNEAYTSKTCGCCGVINHKLGGSKMHRMWLHRRP